MKEMSSTPEQRFIEKLKFFFDDENIINEKTEKRILLYLQEYKEEYPPQIIFKDRLIVERKEKKAIEMLRTSYEDLLTIANDVCKFHNIELNQLIKQKFKIGRDHSSISEARIDFCERVYSKYHVQNETLRSFLNVDHTSIVYYLKNIRARKKVIPLAI